MDLTANLVDSVRSGDVVLVLGAGASIGASDSQGASPPTGPELARQISEKFLGGQHSDAPLQIVSELAISETSLQTVQEFIRTIFQDIWPALFHLTLPTFKWAGLATTNYDLVMERAYEQCKDRSQEIVPLIKNGDRIEEKLKAPRSLMYLKLHGCITRTSDTAVPLILSIDQYVTHRNGRDRVFDHLKNLSYEHPLVFVGHSLQDQDIRQLMLELGNTNERPRYYTVTPEVTGPEERFWESKRITTLKGTFEEFLTALDKQITSVFRGVVPTPVVADLPISERFVVRDPRLSSACLEFLENDVEYVRNGLPTESLSPPMFYRGFNPRWAAVERNLDVRRDVQDTILSDAVLGDQGEKGYKFYAVKGHAGSGKSVLLQRVAWDAALSFGKLCLYLEPHGELSFESLQELSRVIDERIYLFVDDVGDRVPQVLDLIKLCRRHSVPVTVFGAERINEWNMSCQDLEPYVTNEFEVRFLSPGEIDRLLNLLEEHRSLFRLERLNDEERKQAFTARAGRQLLVALHEATLGKPFEDIIADEFAEVKPDLARSMYLGICFLNRFDVPVRAGIVNRLYGIRFTDFSERFFRPLEALVSAHYDRRTRDYVYVTRHPHIAEIIVERVLVNPQQRLDLNLQMINTMNIDYDADRRAFRRLVRGRSMLDQFSDHDMAEAVYSAARNQAGEEPYLLHQMAIYEMNRPNGNLQKATDYLARARALAPQDGTVTHSLAELQLRKAENAKSPLESQTYLRDAQNLARTLTGTAAVDSYGYHTLAKVQLTKLAEIMQDESEQLNEFQFGEAVKEVEEAIQQGLQKFPDDPYILVAESQLGNLLADDDRSEAALQAAFARNPNNPFIAVRLSKLFAKKGELDQAVKVYESSIDADVNDKQVHFNYAKLLIDQNGGNPQDIEYHLRRGFTEGDPNVEAQFWYARQLYVNGKTIEAQERFRKLRDLSMDPKIKRLIRGAIPGAGGFQRFTGRVDRLEYDYAFVVRDGEADRVFLHLANTDRAVWDGLRINARVSFVIGFNFWGATAIDPGF